MLLKKFDYPNELNKIFDKLNTLNFTTIITGGYIRDFFLDKKSKDIDIEVYGLDNITQLIPLLKEFGKIYEVGKSFGVCKLTMGNLDLDFSMPRTDNKVSSGHKGFDITLLKKFDFQKAASRRDFTINTIGYNTKTKQILDPFNGLVDLKVNLLKAVDSNSFVEDPLRVFRAMSMVGRFELEVETNTLKLCSSMVERNMLSELSYERIYEEFKKLFLKANKPSLGLDFLKKIGGIKFFYELKMTDADWQSTLNDIDKVKTNIFVSLVVLCYRLKDECIISFITKLTNNKKLIKKILLYKKIINWFENKEDTLSYSQSKNLNLKDLKLFLQTIEINESLVQNLTNIQPKVHGKDLLNLGFKPSTQLGNLLQLIYEIQLINYKS